jgi:putative N6-adenine-specific DNA methylase
MKDLRLFAVAAPGLEQILLDEMKELGLTRCRIEQGGVAFAGDLRALYRANLHLRTALRVLVRVASFHASAFHELERNAKRVKWSRFLKDGTPVALRVTCRKSRLYHSDAVAQRIARVLSAHGGATVRASDAGEPAADEGDDAGAVVGADSQLFVVRFFHDECTISADSSGAHLHMRGYREATAKAPMRETLAAALIRASGWRGDSALVDPMCGAGTIPIEAALLARRIPPALSRATRLPRSFAFERWPEHDATTWQDEVQMARSQILELAPVRILASDRDAGAIDATVANARRAGVEGDVSVEKLAVSQIRPPAATGTVICNPPYGKRVGDEARLRDLYATFGKVLRDDWAGWQLAVLSGNPSLDRHMRMSFDSVASTTNGGIPVRIIVSHLVPSGG